MPSRGTLSGLLCNQAGYSYQNKMITKHPHYIKQSAMGKYHIEQHLPKYQTVPQPEPQKKNHSYYNDNTHIWNNGHQASSNMKVFGIIKKQQDAGEKRIVRLKQLEQEDRELLEMQRRVYFNQAHEEDLLRLQTRKLERAGLQNLSSQQNDLNCESTIMRPILSQAPLLGRPDFVWNKVNKQSQKHVNLLVNPRILAMEENAIKSINQRIEKDDELQRVREELRLENMNKIRQLSQKRIQENIELQQRAGLSPIRTAIQRVHTAKSNNLTAKNQIDVIEQTLNIMEKQQGLQNFTSRPFTVGSVDQQSLSFNNGCRPHTSQFEHRLQLQPSKRTEALSQPKSKEKSLSQTSKNLLDRSEFKGLYLAQAAELVDSNFGKTLRQSSAILQNTVTLQSRMSAKAMKPKRNIQKQRMPFEPEDKMEVGELSNQLESFERKLHRKLRDEDDDQ